MASSTLTLMGLYNWDNTLFNSLVLPDGIDKDLFVNTLLLKAGEFEVLYPDPDFMKQAIAVWGSKWYRTFAEWLRGTQATWNPIYNYDRFEDAEDQHKKQYGYTDSPKYDEKRTPTLTEKTTHDTTDTRTPTLTEKTTHDTTDTRTPTLTEKTTHDTTDTRTPTLTEKTTHDTTITNTQVTDSTTQHDVSAYDQSGYTASSKDTIHNGQTTNGTSGSETVDTYGSETNVRSGSETVDTYGSDVNVKSGSETVDTYGSETNVRSGSETVDTYGTDNLHVEGKKADVSGSESNGNWHTAHIYGNIGVTQSADMLRNFYDIAKWNLFDHMCDTFTNELLIPVY